ncbi:O-antigen ligase family protein [Erwinia sp. 9145]|uniref:O-antigen ligase family protein n=1 Tax=Erwinia sp. 9145 TaxID=1500895 RepID=UPI000550DEE2|nr:O-antigen ligase family protein [Erwinia sp. 9145]
MQISENNKARFRAALYFLALGGALLSVMLTFMDVKSAKVSFYWTFYFSLAGVLFHYKQYDRSRLWLLGLLLAFGLTKVIWFYWEYLGKVNFNPYNDYLNAGKRLLLAGVIGYWLFGQMHRFQRRSLDFIRYGLLIGFAAATIFGFYQYFGSASRVEFALNRATISAYGYAMLSMMVLFLLAAERHTLINILACLGIFLLSYFVLMQTGTRNMIVAYPLIILAVGVVQFRHFGWKTLFAVIVTLGVLLSLSYKPVIKPRIDRTLSEYTIYENNDGNENGSLTTRLAMWKVGAYCLQQHPFGMNSEARTACFEHYVNTYHKDKVSLIYEKVHLHNEVLDTASLQGIQGAVVLLLFYFAPIVYALRRRNALLLAVMLGVVVSGLTDVVFISRELTVCVALMMIIAEIWRAQTRSDLRR